MKWKQIDFKKLRLEDIFKSDGSPNRVYQVDAIIIKNDIHTISSTSLGREVPCLHFTGAGGPYYRLDMSGREALDALATRNVELQERCEQRDAQYAELLAKWEAKREAEYEEEERILFDT